MNEGVPIDNTEPSKRQEGFIEDSKEDQEESAPSVNNDKEKPKGDLGESIGKTQSKLTYLRQSLADVRERIGVEQKEEDLAVMELEQRLANLRLEQVDRLRQFSGNPEFQRLLPGFVEQREQKMEIRKPLVHGTNSYAFRRIIKDGFVPQEGGSVLHGENVAHRTKMAEGKKNPTSLLEPNKAGEQLSHWYAMIACAKPELAFDSESEIGNRTQRVVDEVYGGVDRVVEERFAKEPLETYPIESDLSEEEKIERAKTDLRKEVLHKVTDRMKEGANIFNPADAADKIARIRKIIGGEKIQSEEGELLLRDLRLVDSIRALYAPRGHKTPRYQTEQNIGRFLSEAQNQDGEARQVLMEAMEEIQQKLETYQTLPAEEREEIEQSFPCLITIEGEDLETTKSDWMDKVVELQRFDKTEARRIKKVEVPESKMETVRQWLTGAGLADVEIVPIEYFEMQEVIDRKHEGGLLMAKAAEVLNEKDFSYFSRTLEREGLFTPKGKVMHTTSDYGFEGMLSTGVIRTDAKQEGIYGTKGASFTDGDFEMALTFQSLFDDQNTWSQDKQFNSQTYNDKVRDFVGYFWNKDQDETRGYLSKIGGVKVETLEEAVAVAERFKFKVRPKGVADNPERLSKLYGVTIVYDKERIDDLTHEGTEGLQTKFEFRSYKDGGVLLRDASVILVPENKVEEMVALLAQNGLGYIEVRPSEELEVTRMTEILNRRNTTQKQ